MGIRQKIGRAFLGGEIEQLEEAFHAMALAYRRGQYVITPETLARQLGEFDSYLLDIILRQRNSQVIAGQHGLFGLQLTEQDRLNEIQQTRHAYHYDAQAGRAVNAWTDFGFGQRAVILPDNPDLQPLWSEFWTARRNVSTLRQRKLADLSNSLVTDGEVLFVFYAVRLDGTSTIRRFKTEEVTTIVALADDTETPLFYVRPTDVGEIWYPDWAATETQLRSVEIPDGVQRADQINEQTDVRVMRLSYSDINGRGWPAVYRAIPWYDAYKEMLQDRAAVASIIARTPRKIKHKGGSLATAGIKTQLQSSMVDSGYGHDTNPPPVAGSPWIESDAAELSEMDLRTGATDGQKDSMLLIGQATAGDGLPLAYRGRPDSAQNRSVSEVTTRPWEYQMDRYSGVWADGFRDMVEIVARFYETYGGKNFNGEYSADISLNRPILTDPAELSDTMQQVESATLNGVLGFGDGQKAYDALVKVALERYGIEIEQSQQSPDVSTAVQIAMENWRDGKIDAGQLREFLVAMREGDE